MRKLYRLTRGSHWDDGRRLEVGETLEMEERRFDGANLKDRFELVPGQPDPAPETGTPETVQLAETSTETAEDHLQKVETLREVLSDIADLPWASAAKVIRELETEDHVLAAVWVEGQRDKPREAVMKAADAKLVELKAGTP